MNDFVDELEYNPFYQALQTRFQSVLEDAQEKCYLICVPHLVCWDGVTIDQNLIENHILRPSPFFQGQYLTTDKGNSRVVHIEDNIVTLGSGFQEKTVMKIVYEEPGYNKHFKQYRIIVLERPIGISVKAVVSQKDTASVDIFAPRVTFTENKSLLYSLEDCRQQVRNMEEQILRFNNNYFVLKDYMEDARDKLESICQLTAQQFQSGSKHPKKADKRFQENVSQAAESMILGSVYNKVYPVICELCKTRDIELTNKLRELKNTSPADFGVRKEFCCSLTPAVTEFQKIDGYKTPLEKIGCIKSTLDSINTCVRTHVWEAQSDQSEDLACVASDELLPLLVCVLIQSQCSKLASNIYYIDNFYWCASSTDELSFAFVTFQAAVEHTSHTELGHSSAKSPAKTPVKEERSPHNAAVEATINGAGVAGPVRLAQVDRELAHLAKKLQISSKDLIGAATETAPPVRTSSSVQYGKQTSNQQSKPQLGGFLSSLQDDYVTSSSNFYTKKS